jgi:hypothetical protein
MCEHDLRLGLRFFLHKIIQFHILESQRDFGDTVDDEFSNNCYSKDSIIIALQRK